MHAYTLGQPGRGGERKTEFSSAVNKDTTMKPVGKWNKTQKKKTILSKVTQLKKENLLLVYYYRSRLPNLSYLHQLKKPGK